MSLKIRDGDYVPNGTGGFQVVVGNQQILEEALFQLAARRGGFPLLPEVGSRLYLLGREKPAARQTMARNYVQEALEPLGIAVMGVVVKETDVLALEIEMVYEGVTQYLEVTVN